MSDSDDFCRQIACSKYDPRGENAYGILESFLQSEDKEALQGLAWNRSLDIPFLEKEEIVCER